MSIISIDESKLESPAVIRSRVKVELAQYRESFLNRLAGICLFTEYPSMEQECLYLRRLLLDITDDPRFLAAQTEDTMRAALLIRYKEIAAEASDSLKSVFRELGV